MADLLTTIQGKKIHDASSFHSMTPNASSYTVWLGDTSSNFNTSTELDIPSDLNSIITNLTTNLILKDTSDGADISLYNRVEIDAKVDALSVRQTFTENLSGEVPEYDPYEMYYLDSYTKYNNCLYRCIVTSTYGEWDASSWMKTSLYDEIADIRGVESTMERVTVHVGVNYGSGTVTGATLSLVYDSATGKPTQSTTLDSTGKATFFVNYGDQYYLEGSNTVLGYSAPQSRIYTANTAKRTVTMYYKVIGNGCYIIDNDGLEYDVSSWDTTRTDGRFVRFMNSDLFPNSCVISKNWYVQYLRYGGSKTWQIENKLLPNLPCITNTTLANLDYGGAWNTSTAYSDCTTPDSSRKTFVDKYNDAKGTSINISTYLPAICTAMDTTETFLGETLHAYLPSMGQLMQVFNNLTDVNATLTAIGASTIPLGSGFWWSSTQYTATYAWSLGNGSADYYGSRNGSRQVLPFFAV